jgi:hypothetical protein
MRKVIRVPASAAPSKLVYNIISKSEMISKRQGEDDAVHRYGLKKPTTPPTKIAL